MAAALSRSARSGFTAGSYTIRQLIVPPLRQTLALAQRIAGGDLSLSAEEQRGDELGQLSQAMGGMILNARIGLGIEQLHGAAEQLLHSSRKNSDEALSQQGETRQAAEATRQMSASAGVVSHNADAAAQAALQANLQAAGGDRVVRQSADQIIRLATEVETSVSTLQRLHQGTKQIGGVLDVIKAVATQTNLLALNVAIEAARAGEQGRGFAVVADEVRALAQRTQDSASEIEDLIEDLQDMSRCVVEQMGSSAQLSQEAVTYGEQARQALAQITYAVGSIERFNQKIATFAGEQTAMAQAINHNIERVHVVAEQSVQSQSHMTDASGKLASELQQLVQQFRI